MSEQAFFDSATVRARPSRPLSGPWRVLPLEGRFDLVYEDGAGAWSSRTLEARELKLGPGRTILGGIDAGRDAYRGFRVDRIRHLTDGATGERVETGILDRLLARAEAQGRAEAARLRQQARARRQGAPSAALAGAA